MLFFTNIGPIIYWIMGREAVMCRPKGSDQLLKIKLCTKSLVAVLVGAIL